MFHTCKKQAVPELKEHEMNLIVDNEREWRLFMIKEIHTIRKEQKSCQIRTVTEIATLKVKAGVWGAASGLIITLGIWLVKTVSFKV